MDSQYLLRDQSNFLAPANFLPCTGFTTLFNNLVHPSPLPCGREPVGLDVA